MKKNKNLDNILDIKTIQKDAFNVIKFGNDTDFSTLDAISQELDKQGIKHILLSDNFDIKTLAAKDKLELLEYIKKEIGLEDKTDSLIIHQDATVEVVLRTITDTKLQFNDLVIEYKSKDNCVHVTYDVKDSQYEAILKVIHQGQDVSFKSKIDMFHFPCNRLFDFVNLRGPEDERRY